MKAKNVSKIKCSFCSQSTKLKIYSCSNPDEKARIQEMCSNPSELIQKSLKIQKMIDFQKKMESDKFKHKNSFLQNILRYLVKSNQLDVNSLPRELIKQDKFNIIRELKTHQSKLPKSKVRIQKTKSDDGRSSIQVKRIDNVTPIALEKKSQSLKSIKRGREGVQNYQKSNNRTAFQTKKPIQKPIGSAMGFKLKNLKSYKRNGDKSMSRDQLESLITNMGEKRTFNARY